MWDDGSMGVSGLSLLGALGDLGRWEGEKGKVRKCLQDVGLLGGPAETPLLQG